VRSTPLPGPPIVDARPGRPTPADDEGTEVIAAAATAAPAVAAEPVADGEALADGKTGSDDWTGSDEPASVVATPNDDSRAVVETPPPAPRRPAVRRPRPDADIDEKPSWREAARSLFSL